MSQIEDFYIDNSRVKIITSLDELDHSGAVSCNEWGNTHSDVIPLIIDGPEYFIFDSFAFLFEYPSTVYIDHTMKVHTKGLGPSFAQSIFSIDQMLDLCGDLCIEDLSFIENISTPKQLEIKQNYPNPFNPSTTIDYSLPYSDIVKINVYDINGNIVDEIINEYKNIGNHSITWAPTNISSGLYFINISQNEFSEKLKLMYIK